MAFFLNSFNYAVIVPSVGSGFSILIDTTKAGTTTNTQFNLALAPSTSYDFNVDWGDGVIESYTSSSTTGYTHTYSTSGKYLISIGERSVGGFPKVYYNNTGDCLKLLNITQFGGNQFGTDWSRAFFGCSNLQISALDFATTNTQNVTSFNYTWRACSSLSSFPIINTSKGVNFDDAWENCTSLLSFPLINTSSGISFSYTWNNCNKLSAFPAIDTSKGTDFSGTWSNCNKLSAFPAIDTSKGVNFINTWTNCDSLKNFPSIELSGCIDFRGTWAGCSSLTAVPDVNYSNAINFGNQSASQNTGIFEKCRSLTTVSIPFSATRNVTGFDRAFLFCDNLHTVPYLDYSKGTTFYATWMGPNKITTFPSNLTLSSGQIFHQAWRDCRLLSAFPDTYDFSLSALDFRYAWYGCISLSSFPLINVSKATNFNQTWAGCNRLTSFPLIDTSKGTNFNSAWYNCNKLTSFPAINTSSGADFSGAWYNCTSLTAFPLINTSKGTDFSGTWSNCNKLSAFPAIDTSKGTSFNNTWSYCSSLTSFPPLDLSVARDLPATWLNCTSLKTFPYIDTRNVGIGGNNAIDISSTWANCSNLTSFPELILSAAKTFNETWAGCVSLTAFPYIDIQNAIFLGYKPSMYTTYGAWGNCRKLVTFPALSTGKVTSFNKTWMDCVSLTAFPLINTLSGTDFTSTWQNCYSLSASEFPTLDMSKMTNGTNCFNGVKLTTTSYSSLLTSLCATNFNNTVTFHGGNSTFNTPASAAKAFLTKSVALGGRGWTINDGGYQAGT